MYIRIYFLNVVFLLQHTIYLIDNSLYTYAYYEFMCADTVVCIILCLYNIHHYKSLHMHNFIMKLCVHVICISVCLYNIHQHQRKSQRIDPEQNAAKFSLEQGRRLLHNLLLCCSAYIKCQGSNQNKSCCAKPCKHIIQPSYGLVIRILYMYLDTN